MKKLFYSIFPLNSPAEKALRNIYHRLMTKKVVVSGQLMLSRISHSTKKHSRSDHFSILPGKNLSELSFVLTVEKKSLKDALKTIKSIQKQGLSNWQIILCDLSGISEEEIKNRFGQDSRILFISGRPHIDDMISAIFTEFFVYCFPGDIFSPSFLSVFSSWVEGHPDLRIGTYDVDENIDGTFCHRNPLFKPSEFSPELLLSKNYLSRSFIRTDFAKKVAEKIAHDLDFAHQEQELIFRLTEDSVSVTHIPQVLLHQQTQPEDSAQTQQVIRDHLERVGRQRARVCFTDQGYRVSWSSQQPKVSIIVPTRDSPAILKGLLSSIFSITGYPDYEVVLVDNHSTNLETLAYYEQLELERRVQVIPFNEPFNYSKAINLGAANSQGELLLFLNNDMLVLHADWLSELAQWALLPEIGIVGAKLLHPDQTIQHAGVVIGLQGFMGHIYLNAPDHTYGLMGSTDWYRDFCAVTGACQMMRRSVFEKLNGYDEHFQLIFSDADICLRAIQNGYRVLYDPFVSLIHLEGRSRRYSTPQEDMARAYKKMSEWFRQDDPYFSPNLTYTNIPRCQQKPLLTSDRLAQAEARKRIVIRASSK